MRADQQSLEEPADEAERRLKAKNIGHSRLAVGQGGKQVIVLKVAKCPLGHAILKKRRPVKHGDLAGQPLADSKVTRFPGDVFAEFEQARQTARKHLLARLASGMNVGIHATR